MDLISLIITIAVVGFLCWLVTLIPMPEPFHKVIIAVVILVLVLYLLQSFGIVSGTNFRLRN